jgi:hypothetical protein
MIQVRNLPAIQAQSVTPASEDVGPPQPTASDAESSGFWARLRPLAYLAPLAVNWPGGRMAF